MQSADFCLGGPSLRAISICQACLDRRHSRCDHSETALQLAVISAVRPGCATTKAIVCAFVAGPLESDLNFTQIGGVHVGRNVEILVVDFLVKSQCKHQTTRLTPVSPEPQR